MEIYNSMPVYGPDGRLRTVYRKVHLSNVMGITSEADVLTAGWIFFKRVSFPGVERTDGSSDPLEDYMRRLARASISRSTLYSLTPLKRPGEKIVVVDIESNHCSQNAPEAPVSVGMACCYDLRFPVFLARYGPRVDSPAHCICAPRYVCQSEQVHLNCCI